MSRAASAAALHPERAARVHTVRQGLAELYGPPAPPVRRAAVEALVRTVLAQQSGKPQRDRAWRRLRQAFPRWSMLADAPEEAVVAAIRPAGLARQKAASLQAMMRQLLEAPGALELPEVDELPLEEARARLEALPGVGPLTAALVLLMARGRPALPVNGGLLRVARRTGMLARGTTSRTAHRQLQATLPSEEVLAFHVHMVRHARETCRSQRPRCTACGVAPDCAYWSGG